MPHTLTPAASSSGCSSISGSVHPCRVGSRRLVSVLAMSDNRGDVPTLNKPSGPAPLPQPPRPGTGMAVPPAPPALNRPGSLSPPLNGPPKPPLAPSNGNGAAAPPRPAGPGPSNGVAATPPQLNKPAAPAAPRPSMPAGPAPMPLTGPPGLAAKPSPAGAPTPPQLNRIMPNTPNLNSPSSIPQLNRSAPTAPTAGATLAPPNAPGLAASPPPFMSPPGRSAMPGLQTPPGGPARPGGPPSLNRPDLRSVSATPATLQATAPPSTTGSAGASAGGMLLRKPDAPSLRVLEPLMPGVHRKLVLEENNEDDVMLDEEDMEFVAKKTTKGGGFKGKGKGRKEKVTAEMRRQARKAREAVRDEKAASQRREREEIFEVGDEGMNLEQLAEMLQVDASDIVRTLFMKGIMLSMNQVLDKNTVRLVASEFDVLVVDKAEESVTDKAKARREFVTDEDIDDLVLRPPVVTVMGHVDHGKTSLLDSIRKARVAAGEAGGITQSIGAYNTTVTVDGEEKTICFLDTPGHEAFSAMRARGTQVTDVAIIIVAADDGVRPQTREAVAHAQAAEVSVVVAINKIDKPGADVERVKQELLELNLVAEEWGGSTPMVAVSAKKGTGIDDLLQMITWIAEEKQLMANPKKPAKGTVIEAHLDRKIGPVATLLVQAGTLKVGDMVVAGGSYGKVRTLRDDLGRNVDSAGPSIAVQLIGLDSTPNAGEDFSVAPSESAARQLAETYLDKMRTQRIADMTGGGSMITLSSLATIDEDTEALQKLNLIIKGDTMGMVEAIKSALGQLPQQSVTLRYLLSGAGDITTSDVDLAAASSGLVLGFNLEPSEPVSARAKQLGVKIMTYKIIYNLIDDVKAAMEGKLKAVDEKVPLGKAEIKALFGSGKKKVAGCMVTQGKLQKSAMVVVRRGKQVVFEGKLSSLRRIKDIVDEVSEGLECGLACEDFLDWTVGDQIECYLLVTKNRRLEEAKAQTAVDMSTIG